MLVRNKIYSFTQSIIESFQVLFRSCQMYKFGVVPANFLRFVQIIQLINDQLLTNVSAAFHRVSVFSLVHCSK